MNHPTNPTSTDDSNTHISNVSFQYGFSVRLITDVVFVCSPLSVATAKGSGNPKTNKNQPLHGLESGEGRVDDIRNTSRLYNPSAAMTTLSSVQSHHTLRKGVSYS
jgi:hypothetical protein